MANTQFTNSYNSISGVDIKAIFGQKVATPLQAVSYAIQREKAPIYTMGYPNPRAFSRGKRGIAGTLIFAMFVDHPLVGSQGLFGSNDASNKFYADAEEIKPQLSGSSVAADIKPNISAVSGNSPGIEGNETNDQHKENPWYVDQIPPFDITLVGSNEYGISTAMAIVGCELVNEGYGISIDDLVSEQQYTFIAREIVPWTQIEGKAGLGATGGTPSLTT